MATQEAVVDAKPSPHLPVDPDVHIPDSVKRAAALAESFYQQTEVKPDEREGQTIQEGAQVAEVSQTQEPAQQAPQVEPARPVEFERPTQPIVDGSWEDKYMAMLGRYQASQRTIGEMQEQMAQLGDELMRHQAMISGRSQQMHQPPPRPQRLVTEVDLQNYGPELLDFTQRAAVEAIQPRLEQIQLENERLKRELERTTKRDLSDALSDAVPNWREIDSSPRWKQWLSLPDLYSGQVRGVLLQNAIRAGEDHRVIGFFRGFLNEEQVTGHIPPTSPLVATAQSSRLPTMDLVSLATPGRAARPAPGHDPATGGVAQKPMITRAQITRFYDDVRKGLYEGRTADYNRDQAEIFAAQREGRILS